MAARTLLALAALADAAVRDLRPVSARLTRASLDDVDAAVVTDAQGRAWLVRAPRGAAAGAALEREVRLLAELRGRLPFAVPDVTGTAALEGPGRAVVTPRLTGTPVAPGRLEPGPGLAASLGRAVAAIAELPVSVFEDVGLPSYGNEEHRMRRLAEVDRAAATGSVPASLLGRWERALEQAGAWRFAPRCVHGDLAAESVLVQDEAVCAVLDWTDARVGDPADDLAWLAVGASEDAFEAVLEAYAMGREERPDADLARRAHLAGELAVARWLLHGVALDDDGIVADAEQMLRDLDAQVGASVW